MSLQDDLRAWRGRLRLTRDQAADKLSVSRRTYAGWEDGHTPPEGPLRIAMHCIEHHPPGRLK